MNKKIIISLICIITIILIVSLVFIINNEDYDRNMIGTYYGKSANTTYTLVVKENKTATLTFDNKTNELTWDNKQFNEKGSTTNYTYTDGKIFMKFISGTMEFSKENDLERIQKSYQVMLKDEVGEDQVFILQEFIKQSLLVNKITYISKEEAINLLKNKFSDISINNEMIEQYANNEMPGESLIIDVYGTKSELDDFKNMLENNEIVNEVYERDI
ncbi:MAG: permease-like cell division protein FtsX [Clostridia bacterium]|nr:permease-like cell division protein FtsX [Clostridia bacterium]